MAEQLALPVAASAHPIARHHSALAAQDAAAGRAGKTLQYLQLLDRVGDVGISDHETTRAMGWPLSSVCSIRNGLGDLVVPAAGHDLSPFGKKVTRWRRAT